MNTEVNVKATTIKYEKISFLKEFLMVVEIWDAISYTQLCQHFCCFITLIMQRLVQQL